MQLLKTCNATNAHGLNNLNILCSENHRLKWIMSHYHLPAIQIWFWIFSFEWKRDFGSILVKITVFIIKEQWHYYMRAVWLSENHANDVDVNKSSSKQFPINFFAYTVLALNVKKAGFHTFALRYCFCKFKIWFHWFLCAIKKAGSYLTRWPIYKK